MAKCGLPCEVWSRVVGYYRPVASFNRGKKEEFNERLTFDVNQASATVASTPSKVDTAKAANA